VFIIPVGAQDVKAMGGLEMKYNPHWITFEGDFRTPIWHTDQHIKIGHACINYKWDKDFNKYSDPSVCVEVNSKSFNSMWESWAYLQQVPTVNHAAFGKCFHEAIYDNCNTDFGFCKWEVAERQFTQCLESKKYINE
jgi:hypothetical protein